MRLGLSVVLNLASFREIMLDGNTPWLGTLPSDISDDFFGINYLLKMMHLEFI